jgi:predicted SprT family Zn-dependent metalloprotease
VESSQAVSLADSLLAEHELVDWRFKFDHAIARCGSCQFRNKQISLSRHFVELNDRDEVTNVLLHEIAHALAGPGIGHGKKWQVIAQQIGARPETSAPEIIAMPVPKWALVCRGCQAVVARRHRRALNLARVRCRSCGVDEGVLRWQQGGV